MRHAVIIGLEQVLLKKKLKKKKKKKSLFVQIGNKLFVFLDKNAG